MTYRSGYTLLFSTLSSDKNFYPFVTIVNNHISITFPETTWLNSSKGVGQVGNFDYEYLYFSIPVDTSANPDDFTMLTFHKGTRGEFDSFTKELEGRAKEWKRETGQLEKE